MSSLPSFSRPSGDRILVEVSHQVAEQATPKRKFLRFGDFEANLQAHTLFRNGIPVELRGQLREMLWVFLERPGEVITQEEFRKLLWPADVNLNFEQSVYTAVKHLRDALGDSASRPQYIETRSRRGYRFIAPVTVRPDSMPDVQIPEVVVSQGQPEGVADWLRGCLCIPRGWLVFLLATALATFIVLFRLLG